MRRSIVLAISIGALGACAARSIRGKAETSRDGQTYLVVDDPNSSACRQVVLDGRRWLHAAHEPGRVSPGVHYLECGGARVGFEIRAGTVFHFDYWGP
jgi:hypothetical protein